MRHIKVLAPHPSAQGCARCSKVTALIMAMTVCAAASHASPPPSDSLGTLFYSPAERLMISRAREGLAQAGPQSSQMVVSGVVRRESSKSSTAWINGQAVSNGASIESISQIRITDRGVVLDGKALRVGEKLELTTGDKTDFIEPGTVSVKGRK